MELSNLSDLELLRLHVENLKELRGRGVIRSSNNPAGDYAEWLFCRSFGWEQANNSEKDADAIGAGGTRYQVKARRLSRHNGSRQLGAIRRLPENNFDFLAGVLFDEDFSVRRAALVPHRLVLENARYVEATNSWRFLLKDEIWNLESVEDVSQELKAAALTGSD